MHTICPYESCIVVTMTSHHFALSYGRGKPSSPETIQQISRCTCDLVTTRHCMIQKAVSHLRWKMCNELTSLRSYTAYMRVRGSKAHTCLALLKGPPPHLSHFLAFIIATNTRHLAARYRENLAYLKSLYHSETMKSLRNLLSWWSRDWTYPSKAVARSFSRT